MKCTVVIDKERDEEVVVYAHKNTELIDEIKQLVSHEPFELIGYAEKTAIRLNPNNITCFTIEAGKVYAITETQKLQLKSRLYQLEEKLPKHFVKINQSCIANIKNIRQFNASVSGSLQVIFQNGYNDYVSRRQLKTVKERLGL